MTIPISRIRNKVVDFVNIRSGSIILDVATGTGDQAIAFARKDYSITGIDMSEDMLEIANKKNKDKSVKFKAADATNMPFRDKYFDVSCVSFGLHDMPFSVRKKVLKEMVRVTSLGGIIVIVDYALPRNKIWKYLVYHFVKSYESKYYPEFIKSDLKALLRKSKIEIIDELRVFLGAIRIVKGTKLN
ncbi:MAG: class I SAM-dependent methyltransferase [Actinomycetota bacterium]|nr:class I SAM-dependent methyltransferase [Actinomycetota bacterium]